MKTEVKICDKCKLQIAVTQCDICECDLCENCDSTERFGSDNIKLFIVTHCYECGQKFRKYEVRGGMNDKEKEKRTELNVMLLTNMADFKGRFITEFKKTESIRILEGGDDKNDD